MIETHLSDEYPRTAIIDLPSHAPRDILLLVCLADTPIPQVVASFGTYHDIFASLFRRGVRISAQEKGELAELTGRGSGRKLTIESYDVVKDKLPSEERVKEADGLLITGSAASAGDDEPWILSLLSFVQRLPSLNPALKTIGVCFGHQIISRAYGAKVERSEHGWEIGTRQIRLTERGREIFEGREHISVHQMHRDHVPELPDGFELLGSTNVCHNHGMVKFVKPDEPFSPENIAIWTTQGHPEFNSMIVNEVITMRESKGVISHEVAEHSREKAGEHDDGDWIGHILLRMFDI
ncbi:putative amidotransferase [Rhodotorula paludigena]|uniref:putative amidotransferase n=1 Tax=Rhodotorula paludigena TaxID=86838 RepID=UPI00317A5BDE